MNILRQTTVKPTPQPAAGRARAKPAPTRVAFSELLPQSETVRFGKALAAAGWSFSVEAVTLVNGRRSAKLDSLPFAFVDFLAAAGQHPSRERLEQMTQTLQADVLKVLPRVGGLLQ